MSNDKAFTAPGHALPPPREPGNSRGPRRVRSKAETDGVPIEVLRQEKNERLARVEQAIAACWAPSRIANVFSKEWGCNPKTVYNYVREITDRWKEERPKTRAEARDRIRATLSLLLNLAIQQENIFAAIQVVDRQAKLEGAFDYGLEDQPTGTKEIRMATNDQKRRVEELLDRRALLIAQMNAGKPVVDVTEAEAEGDGAVSGG